MFAGLGPKPQFLVSHTIAGLAVPILSGLLVTAVMHHIAQTTRRSTSPEVVGLLPALEQPTSFTVTVMVLIRVVRNAAWMLDSYFHTFNPKWHAAVDAVVEGVCQALIPIDRALVKVYAVILVAFCATVIVKWKAFFIEKMIVEQQKRVIQNMGPGSGQKGSSVRVEELERLLLPLDAVSSWAAYVAAGLLSLQIAGINIAPLLAVGGASSIFVGLATQQLLTNATMGLSLFLARPFVAGDSITAQGTGGLVISGVVERVTPMRTTFRTEDDILVSLPNKTVADMVIYNRSASLTRSRLAQANRQTEPLKLKLKVPHAAVAQMQQVQEVVMEVLSGSAAGFAASAGNVFLGFPAAAAAAAAATDSASYTSSGSSIEGGSMVEAGSAAAEGLPVLVQPGSIELVLNKITDTGLELLVKAQLRADPSSPAVRAMLLELNNRIRQTGAILVTL